VSIWDTGGSSKAIHNYYVSPPSFGTIAVDGVQYAHTPVNSPEAKKTGAQKCI